jgi:hypothetical protein
MLGKGFYARDMCERAASACFRSCLKGKNLKERL